MKWLLKEYMATAHIESITELAERTGIARRTLYDRINDPSTIKIYELMCLDAILHFSDEDIAKLARGKI